jgi:glycosyltransferase involved in cell wall biosynthesis
MRILILHSSYLSGPVSGENRVVHDEAEVLRSGGHDVGTWWPEPTSDGFLRLVGTAAGTIRSRSAIRYSCELIKQFEPDLVHFHNLFPTLSPAVIRAVRDVPVVMTLHNYRLACLPATFYRDGHVCEECLGGSLWPGFKYACYRGSHAASGVLATSLTLHRRLNTFNRVTLFLAISSFVKTKMVEAGLPAGRIHVKPHFSWPSEVRSKAGDYFLYLGRLSREKGIDMLVSMWNRSWGKLLVVGDGPLASTLRGSAPEGVHFGGSVPAEDIGRVLRGARALIAPSTCHEGAGKVVLEAYSAGVPVIVSNMGALPEVVEAGRTGLIVDVDDVDGWRDAIEALNDNDLNFRMGSEALSLWKERYSPEHGLSELEAAYVRALTAPIVR